MRAEGLIKPKKASDLEIAKGIYTNKFLILLAGHNDITERREGTPTPVPKEYQ